MNAEHRKEVEVLERRAIEFLESAREAVGRRAYDVACFLAEQSLQLFLKSALLRIVGDYPRTHRIRQLLSELAKATKSKKLEDFAKTNRVKLSVLEDAYIMARYFAKEYGREDAEDAIEIAQKTIEVVKEAVGDQL